MRVINTIIEAFNMLKRRITFREYSTYPGNDREICNSIIKDCWNEEFFSTSGGHFKVFYTRDFYFCLEGLIKLGYQNECEKTLKFALSSFKKYGGVYSIVSKYGAYDYYYSSSDSLALFLDSIRKCNPQLIKGNERFINKQVKKFYLKYVDKNGLIKKDAKLTGIRDSYVRNSSTYDNCMLAVLKENLDYFGLPNPLKKFNYEDLLIHNFWNGEYFYDDLNKNKYFVADANVFPFYFDIVKFKAMKNSVVNYIKKEKLDVPLAVRYSNNRNKSQELFITKLFAPNYTGETVFGHLGLCYIKSLMNSHSRLAKEYLNN